MAEEIKKKKAKYRSALRSIKLIRDAYIDLIQENQTEKISVSDIVKKADINRGTFYAHYSKPSDIIDDISNELIENIINVFEEFAIPNFFLNPQPFLEKIEGLITENLTFYKKIMCFSVNMDFITKVKERLLEKILLDEKLPATIKDSPQFKIVMEFFIGGMILLFTSYVQGTVELNGSNIAESLSPIILAGSRSFQEFL